MIEWQDSGIILSVRPYGETAAVVSLLTREHGRWSGLVQGGQSRSKSSWLQPGQVVEANWRARLADQLGQYALEPAAPYPAGVLDDGLALAGLSAACAVADSALPEREAHPAVYEGLLALVDALSLEAWPYVYVRWELGVLRELGYGIDLTACAVTGEVDSAASPLTYVSPRTGRAVSEAAAGPYKERLLPLPPFLLGRGSMDELDLCAGLRLTGHFLAQTVFAVHHQPLPAARLRLVERLSLPVLLGE